MLPNTRAERRGRAPRRGRGRPHRRVGFAPVNCPTTRNLENAFYPDASKIAAAAYELVRGTPRHWPPAEEAVEVLNFKGPF